METSFECKTCTYKTGLKESLKKHQQVHSKEKPFACHICGLRVSLKDSLRMHIKAKHGQLRGWFHQKKRDSQSIPYFRIVMCMMALTASNVKYVSNDLKRVGRLKDILLCTRKKNLLVISVEENFLPKTIWGCIWKQNMTSKDVDFLRKKLVNSISYFRKILCKAPDVSSVMFVLKTFETSTILKGIMLFTLEKNLMLVTCAMEGSPRLAVWSSISKLNMEIASEMNR